MTNVSWEEEAIAHPKVSSLAVVWANQAAHFWNYLEGVEIGYLPAGNSLDNADGCEKQP